MADNDSHSESLNGQEEAREQSPSEKLETEKPISPATPGIESADSNEIKDEVNPNTE